MTRGVAAVAVAAAYAAAAVAGCGGGEDLGGVAGVQTVRDSARSADAFATRAEIAWMERFADWAFRFAQESEAVVAYERGPGFAKAAAGDGAELGRYRELLAPYRGCEEGFAEAVGRAPTDRVHAAAERVVEGCRHYRRGIELLLRAMEEGDAGDAQRARYELEDGNAAINVAAGLLPPGEKQKLPVARGATGESRIDPRFGEIAAAVAEKEIEARCWSPRDWSRLLVEEKALTRGHVNEDMIAFASAGGERINLGPYVCLHLERLVYARKRPSGPDAKLAASQALGALVHESLHAAGFADEPTTECRAMQLLPQAAAEAGLGEAYGRELAAVAWRSYPLLPAGYRSPDCRPGGKLDLTPRDGRFP